MTNQHVIAVVGTGLIGQAWALVFARAACEVRLWDGDTAALHRARELVAQLAQELQRSGLVDDAAALMSRIRVCEALSDALSGVDYVQESVPEVLSVKQALYVQLDALTPAHAVIGSSTSSMPASSFTENLQHRERCLVAHPVNPPYLVPVVEVCPAPWTAPAAVQTCMDLMQAVQQKPVHVRRELEGFILNRLQGALLREAFRLVEQGYVDADGLDITIREGLGLRWSFMGPFETIDLNAPGGLADYCARYGGMYQSIAQDQASTADWSPELIAQLQKARRQLLPEEALADRRQWRDRRLMALALHKKALEAPTPSRSPT
ncbi:3-hydroxyacyl-CoA dehydrogenase [Limnohabitans sp.]|jgi:3-hydroxyacyl-CoA dehydrogenase|uniref:3-hydroxyacyl-CoA dehydrogenase n=1 Tax=Limnohabitans sp. TaxID=1907725 RepID=UPI0037C0BF93